MKSLIFLAIALLAGGGAATADDGWLGVQLQTLDPEMTKTLQLPDDQGVLVDDVVEDSPAAAAGLKHGDVIIAFQGNPVREVKDLTKAVRKANPGDEVAVTVLRDGERQDLKVTLGERDDRHVIVLRRGDGDDSTFSWSDKDDGESEDYPDRVEKRIEIRSPHEQGGYLGIGMQELTEQLAAHFGAKDGEGVLISEVKPDTPAARAGLEAGDVIVKAGDKEVADPSELRAALADRKSGDEVELAVIRDGRRRTVEATLGDWPEGMGTPMALEHLRGALPRLREFMPREGHREMRVLRSDGGDVDELRGEVDRLRKELDELRQELKDR